MATKEKVFIDTEAKIAADREVLLKAVRDAEEFGRYNDHGLRQKMITALRVVGEWGPDQ